MHAEQSLNQLSFLLKDKFFVSFDYTWRYQVTWLTISRITIKPEDFKIGAILKQK